MMLICSNPMAAKKQTWGGFMSYRKSAKLFNLATLMISTMLILPVANSWAVGHQPGDPVPAGSHEVLATVPAGVIVVTYTKGGKVIQKKIVKKTKGSYKSYIKFLEKMKESHPELNITFYFYWDDYYTIAWIEPDEPTEPLDPDMDPTRGGYNPLRHPQPPTPPPPPRPIPGPDSTPDYVYPGTSVDR